MRDPFLSKHGNKNTEIKFKICLNFFYQSFGCPKTKFGPLTKKQSRSSNVSHNTLGRKSRNEAGSQSLGKHKNGI